VFPLPGTGEPALDAQLVLGAAPKLERTVARERRGAASAMPARAAMRSGAR
jgi:hypothetical protein